ncbi:MULTISPECIES: MarR family winged helix-turn-helix transcriptional regulator [Pseudomonas syringae group]|uniref:MarR family transcriptional regulator n=4 Tax=Pseudomonas syringae group TaxID=136849 RepID=F3G7D7_PSESJ|nr:MULTISPECIES: MarR family transcriptional regulator [Pseudomonas syringae group]EGH42987.1 MarR family transcriptional regulator [Pseudomonas syringae pv. pisi str. 1704B]RMU71833.1 MarR family transcriptional regulator [Pseudomonas syringae pv. aptata]PYD34168.1 MarR family transcriptional regulator [Pseudomonas syringae pv. pisi]PYD35643.1 MarR family transcriptional regulator [Pseudomonas syringae pv. pisi]RML56603.1 MarR family transcriptional regulator [Pseudomonas syringae pv. pisi]
MKHFSPDNFESSLIGLLVGRTNALKDRMLDKYLLPYDVTFAQFKVLIIIAQFSTDTPVELCRLLSLDSGSMTRMLDRLEQKGLVVRQRSATDRRQVRLALTEQGQALCDLLPQIGADAMNDTFAALDSDEVESLKRILTKVLVAADDHITLTRLSFNPKAKR